MIQQGYLPGFESITDDWTNDDWETPNAIARDMAQLIRDNELDILEPAAGSGQIAQFIPWHPKRTITAVEIKLSRFSRGEERCHWSSWVCADYLQDWTVTDKFDCIITNPPFSLRMEFIERSLPLLTPQGRLLFLMPIDFNCGLKMGENWKKLDCHIHHIYLVQNRIAYLNAEGRPQQGRQVYDAVFDIRPQTPSGVSSFLGEVQ